MFSFCVNIKNTTQGKVLNYKSAFKKAWTVSLEITKKIFWSTLQRILLTVMYVIFYVAYSNYVSKSYISFSMKMHSIMSNIVLKRHNWCMYKNINELMAKIGACNVIRMHLPLGALEPLKLSKYISTAF